MSFDPPNTPVPPPEAASVSAAPLPLGAKRRSASPVAIQIQRPGKLAKPGILVVTSCGHLEVYSTALMNRLVMSRDPNKFEISVDRAIPSVVIDNQSFGLAPCDIEHAETLVAEARNRSGTHTSTSADRLSMGAARLDSLAGWSSFLVAFSAVLGVLGVVGGLILAFQTDDSGFDTEYPFIAFGVGIAVNAAFLATIGIVLGQLGGAFARSSQD